MEPETFKVHLRAAPARATPPMRALRRLGPEFEQIEEIIDGV